MTKQAVFRLALATFAVTAFVNTSVADEFEFYGAEPAPLDISQVTLRRAIRQTDNTRIARMQFFTVDTRDQNACGRLRHMLEQQVRSSADESASDLCKADVNDPVQSVIVVDHVDTTTFHELLSKNTIQLTDKKFASETKQSAIKSNAGGTLWLQDSGPDQRRVQIPIAADPINPVLQPIFGTASYKVARYEGKSPLESLGYSVANSTVFWEYAADNTTPLPNAKDLIVNPFVSAVLGEYFYSLEREISSNQGAIMGSRAVGSLAMVVLNPASSLASVMNSAAGKKIIERSRSELLVRRDQGDFGSSNFIGIQLNFELSNR